MVTFSIRRWPSKFFCYLINLQKRRVIRNPS